MHTKLQKWGNSLGLRIPKAFAAEAGVGVGSAVADRFLLFAARQEKSTDTENGNGTGAECQRVVFQEIRFWRRRNRFRRRWFHVSRFRCNDWVCFGRLWFGISRLYVDLRQIF